MKFNLSLRAMLAGGVVLFSSAAANAEAWNIAGAGNWSLNTNWDPNTVPNGAGAIADLITLSGANTYTGVTNVSGGALLVNNSHVAGGDYTVASGATLGGGGSINSSIIVNTGDSLAPGASVGTLTANANVALPGTLKVEYSGSTIDLLAVGGALDITGSTVDFDSLGALTDGAHVFATYGSLVGSAFAQTLDLPAGYSINYSYLGNQIALVAAAHPGDFDSAQKRRG